MAWLDAAGTTPTPVADAAEFALAMAVAGGTDAAGFAGYMA